MKDLNGKVAVVTGAASGIGLGATERLLQEGMKLVLADLEEATLEREVARLEGEGADVLGVRCDVADPGSVRKLAERTLSHFGGVHVVLNNAGVGPAGPMLETTPEDWRWIVDVNILGVAHGITTFGPILVEAGEGHIVNTASEAGLVTSAVLGMYAATKHAVVGMTESLHRELADSPVGVSCLCPNLVRSKIFESERNREHAPDPTARQTAILGPLREAIVALGITPEKVAGDIVDAIREDRFWIFTHDLTPRSAAARFADIQAGRNPTDPYAAIEGLEELSNL
ncbi:MAG: SDR family NAD(P)-dependent oxidoreductase [Deltaproteobacteria bacterium]|nr:SDR family NAD(P)-dependent oxidoreductase [Deltaproteobacteria bacterium]MBW2448211.1 SDR family NAD(P)-dependent oxidoreductase [Deltaproteobacteria bacterium]